MSQHKREHLVPPSLRTRCLEASEKMDQIARQFGFFYTFFFWIPSDMSHGLIYYCEEHEYVGEVVALFSDGNMADMCAEMATQEFVGRLISCVQEMKVNEDTTWFAHWNQLDECRTRGW